MQLDLVIRGQSNAAYLMELDQYAGAGRLVREVQQLLGFDGVTDSVRLIYDRDEKGGETVYPGSAFLGEWMERDGGGWRAGSLEQGFLDRMAEYRGAGMGDATAVVWMHSEYDSRDASLSTTDWMSAVRTDAALVRQTLGRDVPYLFVAAHPYGGGTDAGHQAIRAGMERLAGDPAFDARIAARAPDIDASLDNLDGNWNTQEYGHAHITPWDAQLIAARIARTVAEEWASHAKPGSPVASAGGDIANEGPRVTQAIAIDATRLQVDVEHDGATGFQPLNAAAAGGLGWSLRTPDGRHIDATSATLLDGDSLVVGFSGPVPAGSLLDYAWGIGRVAEPGGPGVGNAVMDETYLPVWTPAEGIVVGAPAGNPPGPGTIVQPPPAVDPATPPAPPPPVVDPVTPPVPPPLTPASGETEQALEMAAGLARMTFGRVGTEGEVMSLLSVLDAGVSATDTARALADTPWFTDRTDPLDDSGFVAQVYQDALGRLPTDAERAAWTTALADGEPRHALPMAMAEATEFMLVNEARTADDVVW